MDELTVVRHQQQAGRVFIQAAYGLHATRHQGARQQRVDARMEFRLVRTFEIGRLVQDDVGVLPVIPENVVDRELKPFGLEFRVRIVARSAIHAHPAGTDQRTAFRAAAETLRSEYSLKLHDACP